VHEVYEDPHIIVLVSSVISVGSLHRSSKFNVPITLQSTFPQIFVVCAVPKEINEKNTDKMKKREVENNFSDMFQCFRCKKQGVFFGLINCVRKIVEQIYP
jgi:hypothetical protein